MKKILFICLFCLYLFGSHAQTLFHKSTTLPRVGDKIYKQEIRFLPPEKAVREKYGNSTTWLL